MINFLRKQFIKILIYVFVLLVAIYFINYFNLSATNTSVIITTINSIFIIFIGKSWIEDYKIENSKELENYKTIKNKELKSYQESIDKSLKDYQSENDEKLEEFKAIQTKKLETHKSKLSGYTLVTKLQFELEFKIYKEIYAQLIDIIKEMSQIYDSLNLRNDNIDKYIESFRKKKRNIEVNILQHSPFINTNVSKNLTLSSIILNNYLLAAQSKKSSDVSNQCNLFITQNTLVSNSIRERIANMKIIED